MKWTIPLLSVVSLCWILGGSYYLAQNNCGATPEIPLPPLSIIDGERSIETRTNQHFSFSPSSSQLRIEDQAGRALGDVARHLIRHPDRALTLSGAYLAKEDNPTDHHNLGLARAESIKSFLVAIDADLDPRIQTKGLLKTAVYSYQGQQVDGVSFDFAHYQAPVEEEISAAISEEPAPPRQPVINTPRYVVYGEQDILSLEMDITLQQQIDNMRSALDLNPGAEIIVTGHCQLNEDARSNKKRALRWADKVRRFFRNNGIRSKEITAYSRGDTELLVPRSAADAIDRNNRVVVEVRLAD